MSLISIRIIDWGKHYENSESRKYKSIKWVPIPNSFDGAGFRRVAKRKDACEIFTAWILLLEMASRSEIRGNLRISSEDAEERTGFPEGIFINAVNVLSDKTIGWIEALTDNGTSEDLRRNSETSENLPLNRKEKNRIEKKDRAVPAHPLFPEIVKRFCDGYKTELGFAYTDIRKDVKELQAFLKANPETQIEEFFEIVKVCFQDSFHSKNLTLRYVCNHYSPLKARLKQNDK